MKKSSLYLLLVFGALSCIHESASPVNGVTFTGMGYKPIYASSQQLAQVKISAPQPLAEPGKIYLFGSYLFINEIAKGIHIIDNADPKNPENLSFISIVGNYDIAVKDNWLYADNLSNLLVFDLSDPKVPRLTKTIENALPVNNFPPYTSIYFECAEAKKGIVIGWERVPMAEQPKCFR